MDSCECAKAIGGKRFLSNEAPRLPLLQCPHPQTCTCQFKHHTDRRRQARRAEDVGMPPKFMPPRERRAEAHGRRSDDQE